MDGEFYGRQDEALKNLQNYSFEGEILKKSECLRDFFIPTKSQRTEEPNLYIYSVRTENDYENNIGFKNLKIDCDPKCISKCWIEFGGTHIDVLHPSITNILEFAIFKNIIPAVKLHTILLFIKFNTVCDINIYVDTHKISNPLSNLVSFFYFSNQYCDWTYFSQNNVRLCFNNPVKKLTIKSDVKLINPCVKFNNKYVLLIKELDENNYEYVFENPINFSMIDKAVISSDNSTETPPYIFVEAETVNILSVAHNMYGIQFSK